MCCLLVNYEAVMEGTESLLERDLRSCEVGTGRRAFPVPKTGQSFATCAEPRSPVWLPNKSAPGRTFQFLHRLRTDRQCCFHSSSFFFKVWCLLRCYHSVPTSRSVVLLKPRWAPAGRMTTSFVSAMLAVTHFHDYANRVTGFVLV